MAVTDSNGITRLIADGAQTSFAFDFEVTSVNENFEPLVDESLGVFLFDGISEAGQTIGVDYTVDLISNTVIFFTPPPQGTIVTILLDSQQVQETVFQEGTRLPAKSLEAQLDHATRIGISQENRLNRAVKLISSQPVQGEITINEDNDNYLLALDFAGQQVVPKSAEEVLDVRFFRLSEPIIPNRLIQILNESEGTSSAIGDVLGQITIYGSSLTFNSTIFGRAIAFGIDPRVGTFNEVEIVVDDTALPLNPILGIDVDGGKLRLYPVENTGGGGGGIDLDNPIADRLTKVKDGTTIESSSFVREDNDKLTVLDETITLEKDTTNKSTGERQLRAVALGFEAAVGTYTSIRFSIDESLLAGGEILSIVNNGGALTLVPTENTGGVELENPVPDTFTRVKDDGTIEGDDLLKKNVGGELDIKGAAYTHDDTDGSGRRIRKSIDVAVGDYDEIKTSIDENNLVGGEVMGVAFNAADNRVELSPVPQTGGVELENPVPDTFTRVKDDGTIEGDDLLKKNVGGELDIKGAAYTHDDTDGSGRRIRKSIDVAVGDYDEIKTSIDENNLVGGEVMGVAFNAADNRVELSPVPQTGGVELENPVPDTFTRVKDDGTIEGDDLLKKNIDGKLEIKGDSHIYDDTGGSGRKVEKNVDMSIGGYSQIRMQVDETLLDDPTLVAMQRDQTDPNKVNEFPVFLNLQPPLILDDPIPNRLTYVVDDNTLRSCEKFEESGGEARILDDTVVFDDPASGRAVAHTIDMATGAYDAVRTSIDENNLVGGEVMGVTFNAAENRVELSPVPQTGGGVELENPIIGRYPVITGDNTLGSGILLEGIIDGEKTAFSTSLAAVSLIMYTGVTSYARMSIVPAQEPFSIRWDVAPEKVEDEQVLQLRKDSVNELRIVATDQFQVPPTELYHVNAGGGTPENVPAFVGHQDVDAEKFVDDSELNQGMDKWEDLELESLLLRRHSATSSSVPIVSGEVTIDVSEAKSFFTVFDGDIDTLTIENATIGSSFVWVLETLGGIDFKIDWDTSIYFADSLPFQSTALDGEVDVLAFENMGAFWFAQHVLDAVSVEIGQVIVINGADLGNIVTASGTGTVVQTTGDARVDAGQLQNATLESHTYRRYALTDNVLPINAGVVSIDVLDGKTYTVNVDEDIVELDVDNNFDRARNANFSFFCEETADGFSYNFGSEFIYDKSSLPEDSVNGGFKLFVCNWLPALQLWHAYRQQ